MEDRSARPDRSAAAQDVGTSIARPRLRSKQLPAGQSSNVSNGICLRQIAFVPNAGQAMCLSLRQRMTVFVFSAGLCCRSVRARGYAPLRGWRSSAGAWIRAPTRRCVSTQTANSQFSILNSQFSRRAWGRTVPEKQVFFKNFLKNTCFSI